MKEMHVTTLFTPALQSKRTRWTTRYNINFISPWRRQRKHTNSREKKNIIQNITHKTYSGKTTSKTGLKTKKEQK